MRIEKIITLASAPVQLYFSVMERSLRATGCDLPLWVIPYTDDATFPLPPNARWWREDALMEWLRSRGTVPIMRKYQCLLTGAYQYVDTDVVFLRNPADALRAHAGFVASCGHWHNPDETVTAESRAWLHARSTLWPSRVFNAGQFACEPTLYDFPTLRARAEAPEFVETCVRHRFHDQPGYNLLVAATNVPVTNLTLPPVNMESTWAGDYAGDYKPYWSSLERMPYLIHWAGAKPDPETPIGRLFLDFLTASERASYIEQYARRPKPGALATLKQRLGRARRAFRQS